MSLFATVLTNLSGISVKTTGQRCWRCYWQWFTYIFTDDRNRIAFLWFCLWFVLRTCRVFMRANDLNLDVVFGFFSHFALNYWVEQFLLKPTFPHCLVLLHWKRNLVICFWKGGCLAFLVKSALFFQTVKQSTLIGQVVPLIRSHYSQLLQSAELTWLLTALSLVNVFHSARF